MKLRRLLGAIDQGTTSTRFSLFTRDGTLVAYHQVPISQTYPGPNMHTQDPRTYVQAAKECIDQAMKKGGVSKAEVAGVGITNQRETIVAWDRKSREPLTEAIVWDDARTSKDCIALAQRLGGVDALREKTGLPINPYFSGTKIAWLVRNKSEVRKAVEQGNCCFSTVESWLLSQLTDTKVPVTDVSNASRTLLMTLQGNWDPELCSLFTISPQALPEIRSNCETYGRITEGVLSGVPVTGCLGDQQAALLGHGCVNVGEIKNTYGTGSFLLVNTGNRPTRSQHGMLTTVFGQFGERKPITYALEGAVEAAGSCVTWGINQLGLAKDMSDFRATLETATDNGGVYFVPALGGLFTPYWRSDASGLFIGLTHHTTRKHLLRAIVEGVAFRNSEAIRAMEQDLRIQVHAVSVDGGMTANNTFLQIQANLSGKTIDVPPETELTSLGAGYAAGIGCGEIEGVEELQGMKKKAMKKFFPKIGKKEGDEMWRKWNEAVKRSLDWEKTS